MPSTSIILNWDEFSTRPYVDGAPWETARDGDVMVRIDPTRRGEGSYVIDGVPSFDSKGNMITWCHHIDGVFSSRSPQCTKFSPESFQVWRDFDAPASGKGYAGTDGGAREVVWIDATDDQVVLKVRVPSATYPCNPWQFVIVPKAVIKSGWVVLP